jgi:hypothetical protein
MPGTSAGHDEKDDSAAQNFSPLHKREAMSKNSSPE